MNIRKTLRDFEQVQSDLSNKIDQLKRYFTDEESLWLEYEKLDDTFFLNEKAMSFFCDSLQQINNKKRLSEIDLKDIKQTYRLLTEYYPDNLQYQEDLIAFVYNVLDDEAETLLLIDKAERRMESSRKYFGKVRREIEDNSKE